MTGDGLERQLAALHPASFGWALSCCRWDREEAEEVLQNVYLKVLEGRARFDGRASLKSWLFAVIRRTAAERRRSRWRSLLLLDGWRRRGPAPPAADPETLAGESEAGRRLRTALAALPRRQRDVLQLVFYQDLTIAAAAAILDISLGSARTHYHRGKRRLRRLLAGSPR